MLSKFFVGLSFKEDCNLSKKISSFRTRFDSKFLSNPVSHMSLLAPFEIERHNKESLIDELSEEIESFFFEHNTPKLGFTGLDIFKAPKEFILYLNPHYSQDLKFCMESVQEICESYIPRQVKYKKNPNQFLPLARFARAEELHQVVDIAREEFLRNSELPIASIVLFEKKFGLWVPERELMHFSTVREALPNRLSC